VETVSRGQDCPQIIGNLLLNCGKSFKNHFVKRKTNIIKKPKDKAFNTVRNVVYLKEIKFTG